MTARRCCPASRTTRPYGAAEWPSPEDEVVVAVTAQDPDTIPAILDELRRRTGR
ncbi:hypothetical protein O3Q52_37525 [Streptomyces sp. ActVer]|uniref:hypothetical protein n=1 Tax=Streptomyces sp. ActVer TaxID=3014558 RepID=UPI0022B2BF78|nr:hypothetical protein [Streptomyces sp. ActVer]MCZ4513748.1 hypothetical protein [Streptomyces sp. ActVer]